MTGWKQKVETYQAMKIMSPTWDQNDVPWCSEDSCAQYDGKRCKLSGFRPHGICEPAVIEMAVLLKKARML